MKVQNMKSTNGNSIPNQFILNGVPAGIFNQEGEDLKSGKAFQSYESIIAFEDFNGKLWLDKVYWNYSRTTSKYRNSFTGLDSKQTQKGIESGEIGLLTFND